MTTPRKKLIEVAIPLEAINAASAREKSIRHGHPSTLHLWWARRPLAACRAVLFAQLVDDPSSHPEKFPTEEAVDAERKRLFKIIEDLVVWENSTNEEVLKRARAAIRKSCGEALPPVYDPFSGGGSISLEAQRLGLPAYGSDLNPVAVMIGKAMIEIPPKFKDWAPVHPGNRERMHYRNAEGLAEDVKHYGEWMREKAFERIGHLYPQVDLPKEYGGGKATVIAWIWARTVPSPDPAFGDVQVPIASSFLLSSKEGKEVWIEPIVDKAAKTITYRIREGGTKEEIAKAKVGTKAGRGAHFQCLLSDTAITPDYIKTEGKAGRMGARLMAIVAEGNRRRVYLAPTAKHETAADEAEPEWKPEALMPNDRRWFSPPLYGFPTWGDLFTGRQLVALTTFSGLVHETRAEIERDALAAGRSDDPTPLRDGGTGAKAYAEAISVYLAFIVDKCSDYWSSICSWHSSGQKVRNTFGRQAIPMVWDFTEANPFFCIHRKLDGDVRLGMKVVASLAPKKHGYVNHEKCANRFAAERIDNFHRSALLRQYRLCRSVRLLLLLDEAPAPRGLPGSVRACWQRPNQKNWSPPPIDTAARQSQRPFSSRGCRKPSPTWRGSLRPITRPRSTTPSSRARSRRKESARPDGRPFYRPFWNRLCGCRHMGRCAQKWRTA